MEQRILTASEYEALGYELKNDITFASGSYSSVGFQLNPFDIAYRADTKQEFLVDAGTLLFNVGYATATGGAGSAVRAIGTGLWRLVVD